MVKKHCAPLRKLFAPLGVSSLLRACPFFSSPSAAVGARKNVLVGPPLIAPEPVTQTLSCKLNLIDTLQLSLFPKHLHTFALICNIASHNSNKRTILFNASTVASLFTQNYGQNQARN